MNTDALIHTWAAEMLRCTRRIGLDFLTQVKYDRTANKRMKYYQLSRNGETQKAQLSRKNCSCDAQSLTCT